MKKWFAIGLVLVYLLVGVTGAVASSGPPYDWENCGPPICDPCVDYSAGPWHICLRHCKQKCWDPETPEYDWDIKWFEHCACPVPCDNARIVLKGDSTTSMLITKLDDGNGNWDDPQYMKPTGDHWEVQYAVGAGRAYRIGLFERGEDKGQNPITSFEVPILGCGEEYPPIVVENLKF